MAAGGLSKRAAIRTPDAIRFGMQPSAEWFGQERNRRRYTFITIE
jgi:hypothetical protein